MYMYTWYQWLAFFYLYCFFGWIFESTYVSLKKRHFINRGFLHAPMLPLYGTGAVMMLWVSLPVKDNLVAVYFLGMIAATVLEYITGWTMERLFKMKYWDYSNQHFHINGYICLSSSIAWGFLTLFLTEIIHKPIEAFLFSLSGSFLIAADLLISVLFVADTAVSVKEALDLAKLLESLSALRTELDDVQVQLSLLKAETSQRIDNLKVGTLDRMGQLRSDLRNEVATRVTDLKDDTTLWLEHTFHERTQYLTNKKQQLQQTQADIKKRLDAGKQRLLRANPYASSRYSEALKELKEELEKLRR